MPGARCSLQTQPMARVLALLLALGFAFGPDFATAEIGKVLTGTARTIDGDTFDLETPEGVRRIRLFGVDAFEANQTCSWPPEQTYPCGDIATATLALMTLGTFVSCEIVDTHYRRLIGRCRLPSGEDVAAAMVAAGWAVPDPRFSLDYVTVGTNAALTGSGAHAGSFVPPADWRRGQR